MKPLNEDKKIEIVDTTLRDGEQTPGIVFSREEKVKIAAYLDLIGVNYIEAGIPAMGIEEQLAIESILDLNLKAKIISWNRAVISDIQRSIECGCRNIHISLSVSDIQIHSKLRRDKKWVLGRLEQIGDYLNSEGLSFSVGAEDASRADEDFLISYAKTAERLGAERFRYCDTVGVMNPLGFYKRVNKLVRAISTPVEVHTHNDFGMAGANALAGVQAGASLIDTSIIGLGERAGNAAVEEVVMGLKYTMGKVLPIDCHIFREVSQFVANITGRELPVSRPVVGRDVFAHESGIHVDGVFKNPLNYEPFPPEEVGNVRRLFIGKHSGKHAIREKLRELGIEVDNNICQLLLERVRKSSINLKGPVSDSELIRIYEETVGTLPVFTASQKAG